METFPPDVCAISGQPKNRPSPTPIDDIISICPGCGGQNPANFVGVRAECFVAGKCRRLREGFGSLPPDVCTIYSQPKDRPSPTPVDDTISICPSCGGQKAQNPANVGSEHCSSSPASAGRSERVLEAFPPMSAPFAASPRTDPPQRPSMIPSLYAQAAAARRPRTQQMSAQSTVLRCRQVPAAPRGFCCGGFSVKSMDPK